jgi:hypothetical protein
MPNPYDFPAASHARSNERRLSAYPLLNARPPINWHALGWCLTTLLLCAFLMGLLAVGSR